MDVKKYTGFQSIQHSISFQPETPKKGKNLVEAGHVRNVVEFQNCIASSVVRQTSISEQPYSTKLWIDENRIVTKVSCTCAYNKSMQCKHIAALIHYVNNDQSATKTSKECQWGIPSARQFAQQKYSKGKSSKLMFQRKECNSVAVKKNNYRTR